VAPSSLSARKLIAFLILFLGMTQILLLHFIGIDDIPIDIAALGGLIWLAQTTSQGIAATIPWKRFIACCGIAMLVFLLGGEGHLTYSNVDWQVRDAVLADMIRAPWPFAYGTGATPLILRAPLGMYLFPALAGKLYGFEAAHLFLWVQNGLFGGSLLALGSLLFPTERGRRSALIVLLCFSGMDILGFSLVRPGRILPFETSIDGWAGIQFSSTLTQAFWVPQHALCGWAGGLLFALWRRGLVPFAAYCVIMPLLLLWSPLGVMGTAPFIFLAFGHMLKTGRLTWRDVALPCAAIIFVLPILLYLGAGAGEVGARIAFPPAVVYFAFEMLEAIPLILLTFMLGGARLYGLACFIAITLMLLASPFVMIGENVDFVMRASIPALLLLTLITAEILETAPSTNWRFSLIMILAIGSITPAREIYRALIYRASPAPHCDIAHAWQVSFSKFGTHTYFAPRDSLPRSLRPTSPTIIPPLSTPCYERSWAMPRSQLLGTATDRLF